MIRSILVRGASLGGAMQPDVIAHSRGGIEEADSTC